MAFECAGGTGSGELSSLVENSAMVQIASAVVFMIEGTDFSRNWGVSDYI